MENEKTIYLRCGVPYEEHTCFIGLGKRLKLDDRVNDITNEIKEKMSFIDWALSRRTNDNYKTRQSDST